MQIKTNRISTDFCGERCYVHARGVVLSDGFCLMTTQKLELSGMDVFYGIEAMTSKDFGEHFSRPEVCPNLARRYLEDGTSFVMCDATPFYHRHTGKILLTGHTAYYGKDNRLLDAPRPRSTVYAVYDRERGEFSPARLLKMPEGGEDFYFSSGAGCVQIAETENGELLVPIYFMSREMAERRDACFSVAVLRCAFDGEEMTVLEIGDTLTTAAPRGFGEPSVTEFGGKYFLALRNDETGYVTRGDGLCFEEPRPLCFDNGENLGNYNTQQHWLTGGGRLYLVYTRKAENNSHMFRHRAPLFIAEFDPESMTVIHSTEKIAVPERGARLGNFGCCSFSKERGYIFAAEWMQNDPHGWEFCAARGSDNSIFVATVDFT